MEHIFTYPREDYDAGKLTYEQIKTLVVKHESIAVPQMRRNLNYYLGHHDIESRVRKDDGPNYKPVCNHAKDITDIASGYFMGHPIGYSCRADGNANGVEQLKKDLRIAYAAEVDTEHSKQASIFGLSYEYIYREEDSKTKRIKALSPMETFIVVDDTIEHKKLFGVNYYKKTDDANSKRETTYTILLATEKEIRIYDGKKPEDYESYEHNLGYVPIIEVRNDKYGIGDFEQVIGLIDAYNALQADRVDDKDQFVDAILVIYGSLLGSTKKSSKEAHDELKKEKFLELDEDARAEYLTHTLDEQGAEVLRKSLKEDIYTLSQVPNLSDQNFAGNSSGVAMEYKLLGLEMKTETKELWYRKALRERLQIFLHDLGIGQVAVAEEDIEIKFSRGLPRNILELSQIMVNLNDKVSRKTLLGLLPFVEDPEDEIKALNQQADIVAQREAAAEGLRYNTPIVKDEGDDE